jgi:hypothetical protein
MATRYEKLESEAHKRGLHVARWSPGDGVTRYRFFTKAGNSYFGPDDGIFTALGIGEAMRYAKGETKPKRRRHKASGRHVSRPEVRRQPKYEVYVGNIGTVLRTGVYADANAAYSEYVSQSKSGSGRAAFEPVALLENGEMIKDYEGEQG